MTPPARHSRPPVDPRDLGAESDTARQVKRIVPWVISLAIHAGVVVLGFILTWSVVFFQRDHEPALITADFMNVTYQPLSRLPQTDVKSIEERLVQDRVVVETLADRVADRLEVTFEPVTFHAAGPAPDAIARFAPEPAQVGATFLGLSSTNARQVVYVIDASGSMIRSFPLVLDELRRSLSGLVSRQRFSVIFFTGNEALIVPPVGRLHKASGGEKERVLAWIDEHVIPAGRSNPLRALEAAIGLDPDVIFLLSENITGSGEFEIDQGDLLALLERMNPVDGATGRRNTQINCVQFLDPDPLDTLKEIAHRHGGEGAYKFLDRRELGLRSR